MQLISQTPINHMSYLDLCYQFIMEHIPVYQLLFLIVTLRLFFQAGKVYQVPYLYS